jgi:hypothetical protein
MKDKDLMWFSIEEKTAEKFRYVYIFVFADTFLSHSNKSTIYCAFLSSHKAYS